MRNRNTALSKIEETKSWRRLARDDEGRGEESTERMSPEQQEDEHALAPPVSQRRDLR